MEQYVYLIIILITTLLLLFIQQYFIQKGKNLATKEDIKSITKDIETIKSKLEISTSNEKWFIDEQNKILIYLSRKFIEIRDLLFEFPNFKETNQKDKVFEYYDNPRTKINAKELDLTYLVLFIDDNEIIKNTGKLYEKLLVLLNKKKEVINKIIEATNNAQKFTEQEYMEHMAEGYNPNYYFMQPDEFYQLKKEYLDFYMEHFNNNEWNDFISSVRAFLKSTERA
jgi:hypothetical protein